MFNIVASSAGKQSGTSISFSVSNAIGSVSLTTAASSPVSGFYFDVTATVRSEDSSLYSSEVTVALSTTSGELVRGSLYKVTSSASCTFSIAFTSSGNKVLRATVGSVFGDLPVTVSAAVLKVVLDSVVIFKQPTSTNDKFQVTVKVQSSLSGAVESLNGPYSVSLAFSPTAVYEGAAQGYTQSGVVTFPNLRVVSKGSFSLVASCTGTTSGSVSIGPLSTFAYSLSAAASSLTPSANFPFTLTVTVNSEDSSLFTGSLTIAISSDSAFVGTSSLENASGTSVFTLRFSVPGGKYLRITAGSLASSMIITVLPCILKVTSFTAVLLM